MIYTCLKLRDDIDHYNITVLMISPLSRLNQEQNGFSWYYVTEPTDLHEVSSHFATHEAKRRRMSKFNWYHPLNITLENHAVCPWWQCIPSTVSENHLPDVCRYRCRLCWRHMITVCAMFPKVSSIYPIYTSISGLLNRPIYGMQCDK